ncbi:MAG: hypothetical protein QM811_26535 [Pirellulales bacterium]
MRVSFSSWRAATLAVVVGLLVGSVQAAESTEVEMFAAMKSGQIEVQYIPLDQSREAKLLIKNKTKTPLSVRLPETFGATPILAQFGGGNNGGGNNRNGGNNNNQAVGGGMGGGMGGMGGGGMGGGGGLFNIAPEKVGEIKTATVCLEHGKAEPSKSVPYEVKPLAEVSSKPEVAGLVKLMAAGKVDQRTAQAAVWHYANDLSWEQLAAKKINRLGRPDEPYYKAGELQVAAKVGQMVERAVKSQTTETTPTSTTTKSSETR